MTVIKEDVDTDKIEAQRKQHNARPLPLDRWLRQRPGIAQRLIILAWPKWEIRDRLDETKVTERVLFPAQDGLCRWLTSYYMPPPAKNKTQAG
ncbi:MAG: hypothetical protein ACXVDF_20370 [Ktedonobacterales bacterium]